MAALGKSFTTEAYGWGILLDVATGYNAKEGVAEERELGRSSTGAAVGVTGHAIPQGAPGAIKRLGYIFGLGGGIVALLVAILIRQSAGEATTFEVVAHSAMAALLLLLLVTLVRSRHRVWRLELATFAVLSTFFLVRLGIALYSPGSSPHQITDQLSQFGFWFPTLYASVLFILGVDKGWRVSVGHFLLSVLVGLPLAVGNLSRGELHVLLPLSQLYLSSAVAIVTMIMFVRYSERVVRANAEMEYLAHTDFITELANRRQAERLLGQEVRLVERYGDSLSLLLLDLDQFKRVNDAHGHPAGDQVLREVAALLAAESRSTDHLGRWGGEEFVLILPRTERQSALEMAARIMSRVRNYEFTRVGSVTVSIGGATWQLGELPRDLIKRADEALYQAKEKGRDQVVMSGEQSESVVGS